LFSNLNKFVIGSLLEFLSNNLQFDKRDDIIYYKNLIITIRILNKYESVIAIKNKNFGIGIMFVDKNIDNMLVDYQKKASIMYKFPNNIYNSKMFAIISGISEINEIIQTTSMKNLLDLFNNYTAISKNL
jgi:hypothetical protein